MPFGKFWSGTMSSPVLPVRAGAATAARTPHIYFGTAGGLTGASMGSPLTLGQWSHLAVVFDGDAGALLRERQPGLQPVAVREHHAAGLRCCTWQRTRAPSQFFNGTLDDVRLYNRAESQLEVQTDMNTPLSRARVRSHRAQRHDHLARERRDRLRQPHDHGGRQR